MVVRLEVFVEAPGDLVSDSSSLRDLGWGMLRQLRTRLRDIFCCVELPYRRRKIFGSLPVFTKEKY